MSQAEEFSTQQITPQLISQIISSLKNKAYGSIEIYVENYNVVQITERTITKVNRQVSVQKRAKFIKRVSSGHPQFSENS